MGSICRSASTRASIPPAAALPMPQGAYLATRRTASMFMAGNQKAKSFS